MKEWCKQGNSEEHNPFTSASYQSDALQALIEMSCKMLCSILPLSLICVSGLGVTLGVTLRGLSLPFLAALKSL